MSRGVKLWHAVSFGMVACHSISVGAVACGGRLWHAVMARGRVQNRLLCNVEQGGAGLDNLRWYRVQAVSTGVVAAP